MKQRTQQSSGLAPSENPVLRVVVVQTSKVQVHPLQVVVQQIDHFGIVEQGDYRLIPSLIGLQGVVFFQLFQKAGGEHNL